LKLVLDSSAALRAAQSSEAAAMLAPHELIAPPLWQSETRSALHEAQWRGDLDRQGARAVLARLLALGVQLRDPDDLHVTAWAIADELGWAKTYDAEFVALARLTGSKVLTTDGRLRRGADRTGLVISPAELP
jgi:predicted nucleic acid-binding protein